VPAGRFVDRFGARRMTAVGLAGLAAGLLALSTLPGAFGVAGYIGAIVVVTGNYALFQAANNTTVMLDVEVGERGVISGMLSLSRNLGLITGASAMGALFAFATGSADASTAPPAAVAAGMQVTFAIASVLTLLALAIGVQRRVFSQGALGVHT
jgi:MFS family permease